MSSSLRNSTLEAVFRDRFLCVRVRARSFRSLGHLGRECFSAKLVSNVDVPSNLSADCKRGRRKGATSKNVKNRQKVSKIFSTLFDNFRAGKKNSKIAKKCQKCFRHFSTIFARHLFSGPFCNPLNLSEKNKGGGGETQGRGKHTINPLPKHGFGTPPHL